MRPHDDAEAVSCRMPPCQQKAGLRHTTISHRPKGVMFGDVGLDLWEAEVDAAGGNVGSRAVR